MEEHVRGWTMSAHRRAIGEHHHISPGQPANNHVTIPWTDQNAAGQEEIAGACFVNVKSAAFIEARDEQFGKSFTRRLDNTESCLELRREWRTEHQQRLRH